MSVAKSETIRQTEEEFNVEREAAILHKSAMGILMNHVPFQQALARAFFSEYGGQAKEPKIEDVRGASFQGSKYSYNVTFGVDRPDVTRHTHYYPFSSTIGIKRTISEDDNYSEEMEAKISTTTVDAMYPYVSAGNFSYDNVTHSVNTGYSHTGNENAPATKDTINQLMFDLASGL